MVRQLVRKQWLISYVKTTLSAGTQTSQILSVSFRITFITRSLFMNKQKCTTALHGKL